MPGASRARSLVCEWKKHTSKSPQVRPLSPAFPARWFTTYSVFSPVRPGFVVTVARENIFHALSTCIGAPGPHGFAIRKECRSSCGTSASTASRLAFVTTRPPLIVSRDGGT
jgi:hypothetical protein